ncbi:UNVERIFIED_CONTAM: mRpL33 [Trichonephila clavipes]
MARAKSTHILVMMKSVISKHTFPAKRARQGDKLELLKFDPYVQKKVLYRELKKIGSVKS